MRHTPITHAHMEFLNTAVRWRGGDVILSAAAPAEEETERGERYCRHLRSWEVRKGEESNRKEKPR